MALLTKKRIDIGSKGTATTGDILYIGGEKINNNDDALFNTFGDQRLFAAAMGVDSQVLHATGYYQKHPRNVYGNPVDPGSMHDVDLLPGTLIAMLPSKPKAGEGVVFINSNGSCSAARRFMLQPGANTINGVARGALEITSPYFRLEVWCTKVEGNNAVWDYNLESMFGNKYIPLEVSKGISTKESIAICHKNDFDSVTLNIVARGTVSNAMKSSTASILIDSVANTAHSSEHSVIRTKDGATDKDLYALRFFVEADIVYVEITPTENVRIALKSASAVRIGDTQ